VQCENLDSKGIIAQGLLCLGSLFVEAPNLSYFTLLYHSINSSGVRCIGDYASGNLRSSLRDEETPDSENVCVCVCARS